MASPRLSGLFANRYLIERELGHGATAVVYLAHDKKQNRQIALKVLSKDLAHALGPLRFLREIQVTARLHHPHILPIFDSGEWEGMLYYVMPFVRGESLRDKIDRESQLPIEECVRITCEMADALAHAHAQGIVHRDVKPENIMLSEGHALLADFGIARTLDVHTGERLTSSGLIVGTSAYMSPEQASGEENIDARSDIYSLACVLYEMIAGVQAFTGPNTQSVIAQRFKHTPRPVSTYRPQVPQHIDEVLAKALTIAPADRYKSVKKFSAELSGSTEPAIQDRRQSPMRRLIYDKQKAFGFAAAAIVLAMAAAVIANPPGHWSSLFARAALLDSAKYAVIPFNGSGSIAAADLNAAKEMQHALEKWRGIRLADAAAITEAMRNRQELNTSDALDLAKKVGAGKLIRVNGALDATLYDVASGTSEATISRDDIKRDSSLYGAAVAALLRAPDRPSAADGGDGRTISLPAWLAYGRGHVALAQWDLARARSEFLRALAADPSYTPARVWAATLAEWVSPVADSASWQDDAIKAASGAATLAPRDRALAEGLSALAIHDYPAACKAYGSLVKTDSLDFAGWYGIAECQARDRMVVPSRASPSGWVFRSSATAALDAYVRAFRIEPRAYELANLMDLQRLLPVSSIRLRPGEAAQVSVRFGGYPSLVHDSVAFFPYPATALGSLPASATATQKAAIAVNLTRLLAFASNWVRLAPASANGYEALAGLLEARGDVGPSSDGGPSASEAIGTALKLATTPVQRARLTAAEIRLRVKRGEFTAARKLADTLLSGPNNTEPDVADELSGVAALTGHVELTQNFLGNSLTVAGFVIPPKVRDATNAVLAHAMLGDCASGAGPLPSQLDQALQSYVPEKDRDRVRVALTSRATALFAPCDDAASSLRLPAGNERLLRMEQAVARHDYAVVKAVFDTLATRRRTTLPGDLSMDYTYLEAWMRSAIGDTAGATRQLDLALGALPSVGAATFKEPGGAASLIRAMMLRADLAAKRGERSIAGHYASAAATLWANADKVLQPQVERMRQIAAASAIR